MRRVEPSYEDLLYMFESGNSLDGEESLDLDQMNDIAVKVIEMQKARIATLNRRLRKMERMLGKGGK